MKDESYLPEMAPKQNHRAQPKSKIIWAYVSIVISVIFLLLVTWILQIKYYHWIINQQFIGLDLVVSQLKRTQLQRQKSKMLLLLEKRIYTMMRLIKNQQQYFNIINLRAIQNMLNKDSSLKQQQFWQQLMGNANMIGSSIRDTIVNKKIWQLQLEQYLKNYYNNYQIQLQKLSVTLFDHDARKDWFNTLKKLTKYHNFEKRDGSFVKSCIKDSKLLVGNDFIKAVKQWYQSIAIKGPTLDSTQFPALNISDEAIMELLQQNRCFPKAVSIDCIGHQPFQYLKSLHECCGSKILKCQKHIKWLQRLKFLFTKQFCNQHKDKFLIGRIILLNKCHPQVPSYGRFRPIRIQSNVVKLMEKYLLRELEEWLKQTVRNNRIHFRNRMLSGQTQSIWRIDHQKEQKLAYFSSWLLSQYNINASAKSITYIYGKSFNPSQRKCYAP